MIQRQPDFIYEPTPSKTTGEIKVLHFKQDRRLDAIDHIIPLIKEVAELTYDKRWTGAPFDAFYIHTDKILFFAIVYRKRNRKYNGKGYVSFADGTTWSFAMVNRKRSEISEKCITVGRRIARIYGGDLLQGKIDRHWKFHCDGDIDDEAK